MKEKIAAIFIKNLSYDLQDLNYKITLNELTALFIEQFESDLASLKAQEESNDEPVTNSNRLTSLPSDEDVAIELIARYSGNSRGLPIAKKAFVDAVLWCRSQSHQVEMPGNAIKWVTVCDKLPDCNGFYFCWCKNEPGLIHYHKDTGWQNGFYNDIVTHWAEIKPPSIIS